MTNKFTCFNIFFGPFCVGANGVVNEFEKGKTNVTKQIKDTWVPFSMGIHFVINKTNLVI
jgi:hypothetical protein